MADPYWNKNGYFGRDRHKVILYPKSPRRHHSSSSNEREVRELPSYRNPRTNERYEDPVKERWHEDFPDIIEEKNKMMNSRTVGYNVNAYDSSDIFAADSMRFINQLGDYNNYSTRIKYRAKDSFTNLLSMIVVNLSEVCPNLKVRYEYHGQNTAYVFAYDDEMAHVMVRLDDYLQSIKPDEVTDRDITIITQGRPHFVEAATKMFEGDKVEVKVPRIQWKFMSGGREQIKTLFLEEPVKPLDEFYPWLPCGIEEYFDNYLASDSNILIFLGEPGAGKTSLIRYLIHSRNLNTTVTYDVDLLKSDGLYVDYLMEDDMNLLLIEDAELILTDRKSAGNQIMSKLLNVSDGLVKVFNKKMIFTANVSDIDEIDSAILRPGRAFDIIKFDKLTFEQAEKAAKAAGIAAPTEYKKYSLAELFKQNEVEQSGRNVEKAQTFGFGFTGGR